MSYVRVLVNIFSNITYSTLALFTAFVVFSIAVWVPNTSLIFSVLLSADVSFADKLGLLVSLYGSILTNFTAVSATYTTLIALLFGINLSVIFYYIRKMKKNSGGVRVTGAASIGGVISGALGIGCASCGTFILTSVLGMFGAAGVFALLPLGGAEFGILGVLFLTYGIYHLLKRLQHQNVCI